RVDRARLLEVEHEVGLTPDPGVEVMAPPLALGQVDDTDRALEERLIEAGETRVVEPQQEAVYPGPVEDVLDASVERRTHALPLGGRVPVGGARDRAAVRGHADEHRVVAV